MPATRADSSADGLVVTLRLGPLDRTTVLRPTSGGKLNRLRPQADVMIEVDGSDGGGQLLRSALTLSALTEEPVRVENVRGGRDEPGLRPQHCAAVTVLADICQADHSAVDVGSETLSFRPGPVETGEFSVDIGTAGSVTLVFDAVLPLATVLERPLRLTATGGTHVKWSPSMDHYRTVKLPFLRRHGLLATVDVARVGFYPKGGGEATLTLGPSSLSAFELDDRGDLAGARVISTESASLADQSVAERQADAASEELESEDIPTTERTLTTADAASPGSAITVRLAFEQSLAGTDSLGEPGRPAEDVGAAAARDALTVIGSDAAVDPHLADQLLTPLAIAGGQLAIPTMTEHVRTSLELLDQFGFNIEPEERDGDVLLVA